ncbi:hypothetical protein NE237_027574 [Protea cynaroides]|uniref:Uncharacterized protein n=1 Tax=Protea cynaroides TaxID=273540 RepID=A0A9Q0GRL7_9MAGN|nr:hypothetical protein NE237_027574 [Protea cynaroides]
MSTLNRRTVLAGVGNQKPSPSPSISRSAVLFRTTKLAAVDDRDGSVEVNQQSQVVNDREVLVNSNVNRGKLDVVVKKKGDCRPEDIDECAEVFIRKFRQQLQIQRLESMEDYQQMLARGL